MTWRRIKDALGRLRASEQEMEYSHVRLNLCEMKTLVGLPEDIAEQLEETIELHELARTQLKSFRNQLILYPSVGQEPPDDDVHRLVTHDLAIVRHVLRLENRKYCVDVETGRVKRRHQKEPSPEFPTVYNVENLERRLLVIEGLLATRQFIQSADR